jgi:hypothetical protein
VDGSYAGGGSDGSAGKPWTTIGAAVSAASPGAIVAVAAGGYHENVTIKYAVKLWGRCPSRVEIVGSGGASGAALTVDAIGAEAHQIALTGTGNGATILAEGATLDAVWVHDTATEGVVATANATIGASLVERATAIGIEAGRGVRLALDASVIRDTLSDPGGKLGHGFEADPGATFSLTRSLLERNLDSQLSAFGAEGLVEDCVVRDGLANRVQPDIANGIGASSAIGGRPRLDVRSTTLERNGAAAIAVQGGDATIRGSLLRDTLAAPASKDRGYGIQVSSDPAPAAPATVIVSDTLVERARSTGLIVSGGTLAMSSCVVRDTLPQETDGSRGYGVAAQRDPTTGVPGNLSIERSLVERDQLVAVVVIGSSATADATVVRDTTGLGGHGFDVVNLGGDRGSLALTQCVLTRNEVIGLLARSSDLVVDRTEISEMQTSSASGATQATQAFNGYSIETFTDATQPASVEPTLTVSRTLLAGSASAGVMLSGGTATLTQTWIRGVTARADGSFGDGVSVIGDGRLTASNVRIEQAARAGLSMFGTAQVSLSSTTLACDAIPLDGEGQSTFTAAGPLACSCDGSTSQCQVLSSGLQPPPAIAPTP